MKNLDTTIRRPQHVQIENASIFLIQLDPNSGQIFVTIPDWDKMVQKNEYIEGLIQNIFNTVYQDIKHNPITRSTVIEIAQKFERLIAYNRGVPEFDAFLTANGY